MTFHQRAFTLVMTVVLLGPPLLTHGVTLHVQPTSTNASCLTPPCHTLSEYAQDGEEYFNDSKVTLHFMSGNHTLKVNLTLTGIHQLEIIGNSSTVVPTKVVCNSHVGFAFRDISKMRIDGLTFVLCSRSSMVQVRKYHFTTSYGLHFRSIQRTEITDCIFQDSFGSALGVVDSHVVLSGRNYFYNNCRLGSHGRKGCYGGGFFSHRSNVSFTGNNIFFGNEAVDGGGIYVSSNSNVNINGNTAFTKNSVETNGGGLYSEPGNNVVISGSTAFIDNSASKGNGGGVYTELKSNITISANTTFADNSAGRNGGGVYAESDNRMIISENTTFLSNSAYDGGGIYVEFNSSVYISGNTTFIGNTANGDGGGIYTGSNTRVNLSGNTTFIDNSANWDCGGGICAGSGSNLNISGNTSFIGNSASHGNGGGVYAKSNSKVDISGNATFIDNLATWSGGGVSTWSNSKVQISGNTTFVNNSAILQGGGGVYVGSNSNVAISGKSKFVGNSAGENGGGVSAQSHSKVNISGNTTFIGNFAYSFSGGGVYTESNSYVDINENTTFIDNSARIIGGGVSVGFNSTVDIKGNTSFIGNLCYSNAGGVYTGPNSKVVISGNTTFIGNSAGDDSGGVYAGANSNVSICGNTIFISNSVGHDGGAVYAGSNCNVNIGENTYFIGNSAGCSGGGVHAGSNNNIEINGNTTFIKNTAKRDGGGVYAESNSKVNIIGITAFIGNRGLNGAGVYTESNCNVYISENTTFVGNSGFCYIAGRTYPQLTNNENNNTWLSNEALVSNIGFCLGAPSNRNTNVSGNMTCSGNLATLGGGVYIGSSSTVYISGNTTFINNSAFLGGGLFTWSVNVSGNTSFSGNSATGNGGGIFAQSNSSVCISGNANFIGNSAGGNGGAVYARSSSNVNIGGNSIFYNNSASDTGSRLINSVLNSSMYISENTTSGGNSGGLGGGFYIGSNSSVIIRGNSTFIGNSAEDAGGGVYAASSSCVDIGGNSIFKQNTARNGGCLFIDEYTFLNMWEKGTFTNCSVTNDGGAVYAKRTQVKLNGTNVFSANKAAHFGGALYLPKSSIWLLGEYTLSFNWAGSRGGGIYAQESNTIFSGTGLLSGNVAQLDGGGIYADGSNLSFSGNITIRNNAAQLGGGVFADNNTFNIYGHSVVEGNVGAHYGGGIFIRRSPLVVAGNSMFIANSAGEGGGIYSTVNIVNLNGMSTFIGNRAHVSGGGMWLDSSKLVLNGFIHFVDCAASYEGGAIFAYAATVSLHGSNTFESNSATTGGGIHARWSDVSAPDSSSFNHNNAVFGGGIFTDNSTFKFSGSTNFRGNQANYTGGGIYAARSVLNFLGMSSVIANSAERDGGGIYTRDDCVINLFGWSNYQYNLAEDTGGGISAFRSILNLAGQNTFNSNHAMEGGGLYVFKGTVNVPGESTFINNSASSLGGGFTVMKSILHLNGSTSFRRNFATTGGGMYISDSVVDTDRSNCFSDNMAKLGGGGIDARNSAIGFSGKNLFVANSARNKGAAVHISFTNLIFKGSSSFVNNTAEYGSGIYSESSNITFIHHGSTDHTWVSPLCGIYIGEFIIHENSFIKNTALRGGALYFDLYSNCSLDQAVHVHFQDNHAIEFGGAIYVVDVNGPGQFLSQESVPFRSECFFHIFSKHQPHDLGTSPLVFVNNSARVRGSALYGGLLDRCNLTSDRNTSALELFHISIVHDDMDYSISSEPTQLCFCNASELNCREVTQSRSIYPGQQIMVSAVAVDQFGAVVPTLIHINVCSGQNLTVSETISYQTGSNCTSRNYSVTPVNLYNQLQLYPSNRSGNTLHLTVNITFEKCPIGFERSNSTGKCICDHRLWQYTNSCDIERQAILRKASKTFWIGVSYNNGSPEGFVHHRYCPRDYCISESKYISLNNPDKQCDYNHSGLLCGKCGTKLSLVLGSSQCHKCINTYLALLIPFALAGVFLLVVLFILHLTVAAGTLQGLIFYANIVAANHHIFFPHTSNNPANIFLAWINLDLGIQTCFYNGLDAYAKTWLDLVFPVYIWVIEGFVVYISHRSVTMTKLLGSRPVPVLATLFLLSYAKVLRTIIAALSLTVLHYPHKNVVVWTHDANVSLAKYIPLVVVALIFLLFLFLPYTLLLLLGQWLQPKSHYCLLSWVKSPKVKAILDTYHAPYKIKHRYWTGLLLLLRCTLFLVFAFNVSGDNSINLLVISSTNSAIFIWFALLGMVYRSWYLNALELSFILNLGILAVATYHVTLSGGSQAAVTYTSIGIAFLTFVGIIIYHIYIRIKAKLQYTWLGHRLQHANNRFHENHENHNNSNPGNFFHEPRGNPTVTRTEVNLQELRSPLDLLPYHQMN